jgi:hypothetical protein
MNTAVWGPHTWRILHGLSYLQHDDDEGKKLMDAFLVEMGTCLPCVFCRDSFKVFLGQMAQDYGEYSSYKPIVSPDVSQGKCDDVPRTIAWMWLLHEKVNMKLATQRADALLSLMAKDVNFHNTLSGRPAAAGAGSGVASARDKFLGVVSSVSKDVNGRLVGQLSAAEKMAPYMYQRLAPITLWTRLSIGVPFFSVDDIKTTLCVFAHEWNLGEETRGRVVTASRHFMRLLSAILRRLNPEYGFEELALAIAKLESGDLTPDSILLHCFPSCAADTTKAAVSCACASSCRKGTCI